MVDGDLGLDAARERKPELVLLDLMMPRMDDFGTLKELKKEGTWRISLRLSLRHDAAARIRLLRGRWARSTI